MKLEQPTTQKPKIVEGQAGSESQETAMQETSEGVNKEIMLEIRDDLTQVEFLVSQLREPALVVQGLEEQKRTREYEISEQNRIKGNINAFTNRIRTNLDKLK